MVEEILINKKPSKASYIKVSGFGQYNLINEKLSEGEKIVAEFIDFTYKVVEESVLGRKELFISSKGKLYLHDSGGFLGKSSCWSINKVVFKFNPQLCKFELSGDNGIYVKANIAVEDFIKLKEKISAIQGSITSVDGILFTDEYEYALNIEETDYSIIISNRDVKKFERIEINYSFIKSIEFNEENNRCTIKWYNDKIHKLVEYRLVFMKKELFNNINNKIEGLNSNLFDVVKESSQVLKVDVIKKFLENDNESILKKDSVIIVNKEKLEIYDKELTNSNSYELEKCDFINNPFDENMFIKINKEVIEISKKLMPKDIVINEIDSKSILIIKDGKYTLIESIFDIENLEIKDSTGKTIIDGKNIKNIEVLEKNYDKGVKVKVTNEEVEIYIVNMENYYNIMKIWQKHILQSKDTLDDVYVEWNKSIKEIINFYYFALPVEFQNTIKKIMLNTSDVSHLNKEDKVLLINILYRVILEYNKAVMEFSLYFSNELLEEQIKEDSSNGFIERFGRLESSVINIYNKLKIGLDNSLDNLKLLSEFIYPQSDIIKGLEKKNIKRSFVTMDAYPGLDKIIYAFDLFNLSKLQGIGLFSFKHKCESIDFKDEQRINVYLNNAIDEINTIVNVSMEKISEDFTKIIDTFTRDIKSNYSEEDKEFLKETVIYNKIFMLAPLSNNILASKRSFLEKRKNEKEKEKTIENTSSFKMQRPKR